MLVPLFLLTLALGCTKGDFINLNDKMDEFFNHTNRMRSYHRLLNFSTGEIDILGSQKVNYAEGVLLGLDSLTRTDNCFGSEEGDTKTFSIQFGLRLMALALEAVSLADDSASASAFFLVADNSVNFTYTIHGGSACRVSIDALRVDRFQDVIFGFSELGLENMDVDTVFQRSIRAWLNKQVDLLRPEIEDRVQFRCVIPMVKEQLPPTDLAEEFMSLIEEISALN